MGGARRRRRHSVRAPTTDRHGGSCRPRAGGRVGAARWWRSRLILARLSNWRMHHRRHAPAGLADLVEGPVDHAVVGQCLLDEPDLAALVAVEPVGKLDGPELAQAVAEPVDAGQGGERVVDRRGQGPDGDLDQLVDGECQVLGRVRWGPMTWARCEALGRPRARRPAATPGQRATAPTKWPGRWVSSITASCRAAMRDQRGVADGLEVAAGGGRHRRRRRRRAASAARRPTAPDPPSAR